MNSTIGTNTTEAFEPNDFMMQMHYGVAVACVIVFYILSFLILFETFRSIYEARRRDDQYAQAFDMRFWES